MPFEAEVVTICSVYPLTPQVQSRPFGVTREVGTHHFKMPPCPKGEYRLLDVPDMWQQTRNWMEKPEPGNPRSAWLPILIPCNQIANDLVTNWTSGILTSGESGGRPGIGIIASQKPTTGELEQLRRQQTILFEGLFYSGQKLAQSNDWNNITALHRAAAEYLNKDAVWAKSLDPMGIKPCPACQSRISALAFICPVCTMVIGEIPPEIAALNQNNPIVRRGGRQQNLPA